jgi:hypothetical protein
MNLTVPVEAGATITRGQMVKEGTGGSVGKAVPAGGSDTVILGVAQSAGDSGEMVSVAMGGSGESQWVQAGGAIDRFEEVQLSGSGKIVKDAGTGSRKICGRALQSASNGELVEVLLYPVLDSRA